MSLINYKSPIIDQQGEQTRVIPMSVTDNYAAITTAGWLNGLKDAAGNFVLQQEGLVVNQGDFLLIAYSSGASQAAFQASISNGVYTLAPMSLNGLNAVAISSLAAPDAQSDVIWYDVTASAAALASAGKVNVQISGTGKQYKVRDVKVNYGAAGLSGGGGDRLLVLTDGTTVYNNAGITAALLGTPVNTLWGGSGNPLPGTVAMDTPTVAGANLYFQYSGGTIDYTTGSVVISVCVQRVA